jgi:hypothetical protein
MPNTDDQHLFVTLAPQCTDSEFHVAILFAGACDIGLARVPMAVRSVLLIIKPPKLPATHLQLCDDRGRFSAFCHGRNRLLNNSSSFIAAVGVTATR